MCCKTNMTHQKRRRPYPRTNHSQKGTNTVYSVLLGEHKAQVMERSSGRPVKTPAGHVYEVPVVWNSSANPNYRFVDVELLQAFKPLIVTCYVVVVLMGVLGN
ncbi:hypothetical protein P4O66_005495 [Electrophorus voltai]|uniref:Uncharacterized protein n=1 Tax=Electrophorus voltai TaxID=2609070 RepID=A0AAD8ZN40_9TELE|nr:hypothetical protein P4O66_005495 [Electrophorus voltai]